MLECRKVYFQAENLTIQFENEQGFNVYEVDIEQATSSAILLNFILQVNRKKWATPSLMKDFLGCIEEACRYRFNNNAQGVFCPFGDDLFADWSIGESKRPQ